MGRILEAQKQAKRQALLDAAYGLFLEQGGTEKASISDIAARAGVAKGTFYLYFPGKEGIVQALCDKISDRVLHEAFDAMQKKRTDELAQNVILLVDFIVEYFKKDPLVLRVLERKFSWPHLESKLAGGTDPMFSAMMQDVRSSAAFAQRSEKEIFYLIFSMISLCGTVCYTSIIEHRPAEIDAMKPALYEIIRKTLQ